MLLAKTTSAPKKKKSYRMSKKHEKISTVMASEVQPEVTGSNTAGSESEEMSLEVATRGTVRAATLIEPIEAYASILTNVQRAAIREYRISCFPRLFANKTFQADVESKHPVVEMTEAAKLYTALCEKNFMANLKKISENKAH